MTDTTYAPPPPGAARMDDPYDVEDQVVDTTPFDEQPIEDRSLFRNGASFVLDVPDGVPAVWGSGDEVLWAAGEALMVVGPQGVGKSTVIQQLVRARLGLGDTRVLGFPVEPGLRNVLYLACDRPRQIRRSMARMFTEADRTTLDQRLVVWEGPPPHDFAKHPNVLATMCHRAGADTVIVDSLKDVAVGLKEDEVGAAYNRARQLAITHAGVEIIEAHHQTKRGAGGTGKPDSLADVYGSGWLTAGAGSVLLLWGEAGDPIVEMRHLKQPHEPVGPLRIRHDHQAGTSHTWHVTDLVLLASAAIGGITAKQAATALFDTQKPTASQTEKARRKLEALAKPGGLLRRHDGDPSTQTPTRYEPADRLPIGA